MRFMQPDFSRRASKLCQEGWRGRACGFSLLELLLVTALFGALATILLNRLTYYQEAAEKANMEYTISAIKSALRLRMASLMTEGRMQESILLAQQNPMDWLDKKPDNYHGQFPNPDPSKIPPGSWYFDSANRTLVYLIKSGEYFQPDSSGAKRVRLKVTVVPNQPEVMYNHIAADPTDTVALRLLETYKWQ